MISDEELDFIFKVVFLGDSSVGKSNIISKYKLNEFNRNSKSTVGVEFYSKIITQNNKNIKIQIWDTAGQERFKSITKSYYKGAKGAIIVYDITRRATFENVQEWFKDTKTMGDNTHIVLMLVGNKCDLENERAVTKEEANQKASAWKAKYIETSALTDVNKNCKEPFIQCAKAIKDNMVNKGKKELKEISDEGVDENGDKKPGCKPCIIF